MAIFGKNNAIYILLELIQRPSIGQVVLEWMTRIKASNQTKSIFSMSLFITWPQSNPLFIAWIPSFHYLLLGNKVITIHYLEKIHVSSYYYLFYILAFYLQHSKIGIIKKISCYINSQFSYEILGSHR